MADIESAGRPHCSTCGVDMWLTRIGASDLTGRQSYSFECKVCGAETALSVEEFDVDRVENGL